MNANTARVKRNRAKKLAIVQAIKSGACTDCGGTFHPEAMQFDHVGEKFAAVSSMLTYGIDRILAEVAKCELVCANCHAVRTHKRRTRVVQW